MAPDADGVAIEGVVRVTAIAGVCGGAGAAYAHAREAGTVVYVKVEAVVAGKAAAWAGVGAGVARRMTGFLPLTTSCPFPSGQTLTGSDIIPACVTNARNAVCPGCASVA